MGGCLGVPTSSRRGLRPESVQITQPGHQEKYQAECAADGSWESLAVLGSLTLEVGPTGVGYGLVDQGSLGGNLIAHLGFNFLLPLPYLTLRCR